MVVFCLLLSSLSFTPTKRYEEVDGVRKEKERLTTDHLSPRGEDWSLTFRFLVLSYTSAKGRASTSRARAFWRSEAESRFLSSQTFRIPNDGVGENPKGKKEIWESREMS